MWQSPLRPLIVGYTGVVLFLDELVLWLQAKMGNQDFVRDQVQRLVKLIESADSGRPVPIVSFISRQRDLSQLIGSDVVGADVTNLEQQIEYLAERCDVVDLEDSNLIEIIKHRVLSPKSGRIDPSLLTERVDGPRRLLLAGRSWQVTYIDWRRKRCFVEPVDGEGKAKWSGAGFGTAGSYELTRAERQVLLGGISAVTLV